MGTRDSYPHGTFCWIDLASSDQEGSKKFYGELLGWDFEDNPVGDGQTYSLGSDSRNGKQVAAIFTMNQEMQKLGVPSYWQSYISVENVDEMVKSCRDAGATINMEPFDVFDVGRMAVIQDPSGARVNFWQPKTHVGAAFVNDPHAWCWNELDTYDLPKAKEFFTKILGWEYQEQSEPAPYTGIMNKGKANGGMLDISGMCKAEEVPPHWKVYFNVANLDDSLKKVEDLGGKQLMDPMDPGVGRFCVIQDPQQAVLALIQLTHADP